MSNYDAVKRWRSNAKSRLVACFGGKCGICLNHYPDAVFDFHHIDPSKKHFQITASVKPWRKIIAEAKKCAMLCSNCHRLLHAGFAVLPEKIASLDESAIVGTELEIKSGVDFKNCPICEKLIPITRKTCSLKCSGKLRTHHKKPKDISVLVPKIQKFGYSATAREIGVSDNTIRNWFMGAGVDLPS